MWFVLSSDKVYVKVFRHREGVVLAICDPELIGKKFREGKRKLEVSAKFYKGQLVSVEEAINMIAKADIINIVGVKVIGELLKRKIIPEDAVISIGGVPHIQLIKV